MSSDEDLAEVARARGQVGTYNRAHWLRLIAAHTLAKVLAACDEHWMDNEKPATGMDVEAILGGSTACRPSRVVDDDEEPAAPTSRASADTTPEWVPPTPAPAAPAAAETDRSPTAPAAGEKPQEEQCTKAAAQPWGLKPSTTLTPESIMANSKNDQLVKRIKDRMAAQNLSQAAAAKQIGCSTSGLYQVVSRRVDIGSRMLPLIETWLEALAPASEQSETAAAPSPKAKATPSMGGGAPMDPDAPADLLARGAALATNLAGVGAIDGAEIVNQLVDRLRQVRTACTF